MVRCGPVRLPERSLPCRVAPFASAGVGMWQERMRGSPAFKSVTFRDPARHAADRQCRRPLGRRQGNKA
ncbi:MAG: hypothetical protein OJF58_004565 [Enhydrobacter sp.]|nr:MAG: hypothetical protein OJF58_004565 [Enhydrobacter sp.]